ncbi:Chitinase [Collimonas arenae]|uniref:Chitinase n=2 Tax=Collimonas arenae TaxID=279058 RepID=A0A0A1FJ30_9BURK|nr:Chitinase [Collimonas arenae]
MWGAGGGGSAPAATFSGGGGAGGYATGNVAVTPGTGMAITVGQGGVNGAMAATYGRGGGGGGGANNANNQASTGSSGGGMSALWGGVTEFAAGTAQMVAGGGGGSNFWNSIGAAGTSFGGVAGGGGGASGGSSTLEGGQGGTQAAGGALGTPDAGTVASSCAGGTAGSAFQGGTGCSAPAGSGTPAQYEGGGGGGGGFYGGGGGMAQCTNTPNPLVVGCSWNGPGGGGSGYLSASVSGGVLTAGPNANYTGAVSPPNPAATSSLYQSGVGVGGASSSSTGSAAGNGLVVIQFNELTLQLKKTWAAGGNSGDVASIGATTGGNNPFTPNPNNTFAFTATDATAGSSNVASIAVGNTITFPAETMTTGKLTNYNTVLSCTANGGATANVLSGTNGQVTNTLVIGVGDLGKAIVCTYTNTPKSPVLTFQKALGGSGRIAAADQFALSGTGTGAPAATNTTGAAAAVTSPAYSFTGTAGTAYSLNEAMAAGSSSTLGQYSQSVACTNVGGTTSVSGLTSLPINVTPVIGDNISCTITNTPKPVVLTLKKALGGTGRIAGADQFALSGTGTGAPAATNTTGAGTSVTSSAYSFTATAGTAYTLNEAMAAGSSSTLGQYSQSAACTNVGGTTNVSGLTNLPINVTPVPGDNISCTITNTPKPVVLTLQKALGGTGRIAAADQFALSGTGTGAPAAANTTGTGTAVTSPAYSFTGTAGTAYTLNEAMAAGSSSVLSQYSQSVACTNASGTTNVSGLTSLPINVTPVAGDNISCTITNTPKSPVLTLKKALGGTGRIVAADQFALSGTGSGAPAAINTTGSGASITSPAYSFTATAGTAYTLNEAMAAGSSSVLSQYSQSVACTNVGGTTNVSGLTSLPINLTPVAGDNISCTITNTPKPVVLTLQKALGGTGRIAAADQFALSGTGAGAPAAINTTGTVAAVTSPAYSFTGTAGTAYTLNEAMAAGSSSVLSQYSQSVSCTNAGGTTSVAGLTSLPINVTPVAGDNISCTITNTPKPAVLTLQKTLGGSGRVAAADQFALSGTGAGAPAATNTTGTAATVTSPAYSFTGTAGTAYTLNEAMAAGSSSVLSQYSQSVSCTNAGGTTSVAGLTSLPINVTPRAGDNISCTIINTPKPVVLTLQKALGGSGRIAAADQFALSGTGAGAPAATNTTGTATAVTSPAYSFTGTAGAAYTLNEAMATGSSSVLGQYSQSVICTNAGGTTNVSGLSSLPINVTPVAGDNISCTITNTPKPVVLTLQKALGSTGRIAAADQFALSGTGTGAPAATNTTGSGTSITSPAYSFTATAGTAYTLNEAMAAGSSSVLSQYSQSVACTNVGGVTNVSGLTSLPINVTPVAGDNISCTITNTMKPATVQISKISLGGASSFDFTGTNGITAQTITTSVAGTPVNGPVQVLTAAGTATSFAETYTPSNVVPDYVISSVSCTGMGAGGTVTRGAAQNKNQFTLDAAATAAGSNIVCTVTNAKSPTLQMRKNWVNAAVNDFFRLTATGGGVASLDHNVAYSYNLDARAATPNETDVGGAQKVAVGDTVTLSESTAGVVNTSTYVASAWSCTGGGVLSGNTLTLSAADAGAAVICQITNTGKTQLTISKVSQGGVGSFSFSGTNGITAQTLTTATAGTPVSGPVQTLTTSGAVTVITEAIPSGYVLTAASCTGMGSGGTATADLANGNLTLDAAATGSGNNLACTFTNTKTATVTLAKSWSGATAGDTVSVTGTGLSTLTSTATGVNKIDTGTATTVLVGSVINLAEAFTSGIATSYSSAVACTGTSGLSGSTLTVGASDTVIVCTYTNTKKSADASNSGLRVVTNNQPANGVAQDVLEAFIRDSSGNPVAGAVVTFAATPSVNFGAGVGVASTCTTVAAGTCSINATTLNPGTYSTTGVSVGGVALSGTFTVAGNNYLPSPQPYTFAPTVPKVQIIKTTTSGSGSNTFNFGLSGLSTGTDTITVVGAGTANGASNLTGLAGQAASITETSPAGWPANPVSASCVDLASSNPTATFGSLNGNQLSIPAANMVAGANIRCTFTNSFAFGVSGRVFLDNGAGAGTPNDGLINGAETGIAGVSVTLTNCVSNAAISSAVTDGSGNYSLSVPFSTAVGASLCVNETNSGIRISTGASVGSTPLPSGTATAAAGGTYTYTRNGKPDTIAFTWNGSGNSGLNFGQVDPSTFATSGAKTGQPGSTVTYAHTFTAGTGGSVSFQIASSIATPTISGWSEVIFADPTCSGSLQPGAAKLYPPSVATTVTAGQAVCIIVQEFVPASAQQGNSNDAKVQANFTFANANPALSASYTLDDVTTVSDNALDLKKEVRNVTQSGAFGINNQAKSGEVLEYSITYTNNGTGPISNLLINDATPQFTTFVASTTGATPATLTVCVKNTPANEPPAPTVACSTAQAAGGTGPLNWKFTGPLAPGASGTVLFSVKVN